MLIDIPAVADTDGTVDNITWRSDGTYAHTGIVKISGAYVSGTFTDNETITQDSTGATALIRGAGQTAGSHLVIDALNDTDADAVHAWVGGSSAAIFLPDTKPYLPQNFFIWIDRGGSSTPYVLRQNSQDIEFTGTHFILSRNPPTGSTMKALTCVDPTFTVPPW
jgi:hypothetical protein